MKTLLAALPSPATTNLVLHDIKAPVEIPSYWPWIGGALLVLALAMVAWWWRRRGLQAEPVVNTPAIPPHIIARKKLEKALALLDQPKPFVILVSDTLRSYLEDRFQFHAPERTSEEFLYELQNTRRLSPAQKESLAQFLSRSDLVKFARYEPGPPELRELHRAALQLVEETIPEPAAKDGFAAP